MSSFLQKKNTIDKMVATVFRLEARLGHLKWKVSDLARAAKVSRPLVYLYLGKSKQEILSHSIDIFVTDFYRLGDTDISFEISAEAILTAQKMVQKNPEAMLFYLTWRHKDSWINNKFQEVEKAFQKKLSALYPGLGTKQISFLYAVLHGLTTAPFLDEEQVQEAIDILQKNFKKAQL